MCLRCHMVNDFRFVAQEATQITNQAGQAHLALKVQLHMSIVRLTFIIQIFCRILDIHDWRAKQGSIANADVAVFNVFSSNSSYRINDQVIELQRDQNLHAFSYLLSR